MKRIFFIRHGESTANAGLLVTTDVASIPLTEKGHAQALALSQSWQHPPDVIFATPHIRTQLTAAPTRQRFPEAPFRIVDLQEFTYLDGPRYMAATAEQRVVTREAYWERMNPDYVDSADVESFNTMLGRIKNNLHVLNKENVSCIFVFTHGLIMKTLRGMLEFPQLSPAELMRYVRYQAPDVDNCDVMQAKWAEAEWKLI